MKLVKIPRSRITEWLKILEISKKYAVTIREKLGKASILLHGSYARGDFNLWSDIDLIIVSDVFRGIRVLDRYELLPLLPRIEPLPLTYDEFLANIKKSAWVNALKRGLVVIVDDYNLASILRSKGINVKDYKEFYAFVEKLLKNT